MVSTHTNSHRAEAESGSTIPPVLAVTVGLLSLSSLSLSIIFLVQGIRLEFWQYYLLAASNAQFGMFGLLLILSAVKKNFNINNVWPLSASLAVAQFAISLFLQDMAIPMALLSIVYSLVLSSSISSHRSTSTIIAGLINAAAIALSGTFFQAYQIQTPEIGVIIPVLLSIMIIIYVTLLVIQVVSASLPVRLTTSFLTVVILPLVIVSAIQGQISNNRLRTETFSSLTSTADEVAIVLDNFISNNVSIIKSEANNTAFSNFLSSVSNDPEKEIFEKSMRAALSLLDTRESSERNFLSSYALLDQQGLNVYDTVDRNIGNLEAANDYFRKPMQTGEPYYSPVLFDDKGIGYIYFSAPVKDASRRNIIGVLRSRYNALVLQRLATRYSRMISFNSHAIVLDENLIRLADDYQPILVYTPIAEINAEKVNELKVQNRMPDLSGRSYTSDVELAKILSVSKSGDTAYIGMKYGEDGTIQHPETMAFSATRLQNWKIIYLKADYGMAQIVQEQTQTSVLIASIVSLLVGLIATGASRLLARPLVDLTRTAMEVTSGNLNARAADQSSDEFGTLGAAFNIMTDRLRSFIGDLEKRVAQRTQELELRNQALSYRSAQLQTVAEVARSVVSSQEMDSLLNSLTELISVRFGFYHVGVFLLDERKENAVLRAANSEGGKRMLARRHSLQVGKVGIVGHVTSTGEARIATDVGKDAVYFNNPELPLTRSELALPLKVGDTVIGALDVQSTESNAFKPEDVTLFSTLADQVAVAIQNNQLYARMAEALADAQATHRQYLRQEWHSTARAHRNKAYRYTVEGISPSAPEALLIDSDPGYQTGEPLISNETMPDGTNRVIMEVPIILRGETIGAIRVQDQSVGRLWSNDEAQAVQDVAQQVGVALESARLFESTVQRADRERKVLEITGRIRATNDPQKMLEIAAAELQRALGATRAQVTLHQTDPDPDQKPYSSGYQAAKETK